MHYLISFVFLYTALFIFERRRMQLDAYLIAVVAIAPAIILALNMYASLVVSIPGWISVSIDLSVYPITFLLLWKMLGLGIGRSIAYTAGLFVFNGLLVSILLLATGLV